MVSEEQLQAIHQKLQTLKESGELNGKGADRSENLHRLFMYPAMMVPAAQYAVIKAVADCLPVGAWAMDPFMGSGTSLMTCMEFGFNVYGQDVNPFAVMLSKAKVEKYDIHQLKEVCQVVLDNISKDEDTTVAVTFRNIDKWFNPDIQIDLSKIRSAYVNTVQTTAISKHIRHVGHIGSIQVLHAVYLLEILEPVKPRSCGCGSGIGEGRREQDICCLFFLL